MKTGRNGNKEIPHPQTMIEVMANTREDIEGYAATTGLTFEQAASVLVFNELRCIHWHFDQALVKQELKTKR